MNAPVTHNVTPGNSGVGIDWKMVIRFALVALLVPLLLFVAAGRVDWWQGWVYAILTTATSLVSRYLMIRKNPDLVAERAHFTESEGIKDWDKRIVIWAAIVGPLVFMITAGLDKRFGWSAEVALALQLGAIGVFVLGYAFATWALVANKFFSSVVRIQTERGHTVSDDQPSVGKRAYRSISQTVLPQHTSSKHIRRPMMFTIQSKVHVEGIGGLPIFNFLINPSDSAYQSWWPGTHLKFHNIHQIPGHIGNVVYMDEYVGKRRLRMRAVVTEAQPGKKITWQCMAFIRLPVWVRLELKDDAQGVDITHTMIVGFAGIGRVLDGLFRLYLSDDFAKAMDEHARIEFPKLGELLSSKPSLMAVVSPGTVIGV